MNNPFKKQFRIFENTDSNGNSTFFPERTILGIWTRYEDFLGSVEFDSYKEANKWMCYRYNAKKTIHEMDEIFNNLVK